jgi:hypothetical protein
MQGETYNQEVPMNLGRRDTTARAEKVPDAVCQHGARAMQVRSLETM